MKPRYLGKRERPGGEDPRKQEAETSEGEKERPKQEIKWVWDEGGEADRWRNGYRGKRENPRER